jgi:hypothetical protein
MVNEEIADIFEKMSRVLAFKGANRFRPTTSPVRSWSVSPPGDNPTKERQDKSDCDDRLMIVAFQAYPPHLAAFRRALHSVVEQVHQLAPHSNHFLSYAC